VLESPAAKIFALRKSFPLTRRSSSFIKATAFNDERSPQPEVAVFNDHIPRIHHLAREVLVSPGTNGSGKLMIRRHGRCGRTISGVA
jgi:hypothetical protein